MTLNPSYRDKFYIGVDLGQSADPTAIAIVKRIEFMDEKKRSVFQLGFLERAPLGTPYPVIVTRVGWLMQHPTCAGKVELAIDQTGVGGPVADMFRSAGIPFHGVVITSGHEESKPDKLVDKWHVPKLQLVSGLQALLHEGRLQIQKNLKEADTLIKELQNFKVRYSESGYMSFNAREGAHDDLVLALAIAVWKANKPVTGAEAWLEFYHRLSEEPRRFAATDLDDIRAPGPELNWSFSSKPPVDFVTIVVPSTIGSSHVITISGQMIQVDVDVTGRRTVKMSVADARAMLSGANSSAVAWWEANLDLAKSLGPSP